MPPSVSVVIPTHDRLSYLREAVSSVQDQTLGTWELIIVDDASHDGTPEWLSSLDDARITTLRLDRPSERGKAMNLGAEQVGSDLVLFLDDDDKLTPRALEDLSLAIARSGSAIAAVGGMRFFDAQGNKRRMPHPRLSYLGPMTMPLLSGWNIARAQVLMRKSAFERAGRWDETSIISDDIECLLRLSRLGDMVVVAGTVCEKRVHPGNTYVPELEKQDLEMRRRFVQTLPEERRPGGLQALHVRRSWLKAHDLYHHTHSYRLAFLEYATAVRTYRGIPGSRRVPPGLALGLLKSGLGALPGTSALLSLLRRTYRVVATRLGRYPDLSPKLEGSPNEMEHT